MRLKVLNAIKDPRLEPLRRQNPGKITRRPLIGGRPLAPGSSRIFNRDQISAQVMDELEAYAAVGLIRVFQIGRGGEADLSVVRQQLGLAAPAPTPVPDPVSVPEPKAVVAPAVAAPAPAAPPAASSSDSFVLPDDFASRLRKPRVVTNDELREMLTVLGGSGSGKKKYTLVREIMEAISADDVDTVSAAQVVDMLKKAEQ